MRRRLRAAVLVGVLAGCGPSASGESATGGSEGGPQLDDSGQGSSGGGMSATSGMTPGTSSSGSAGSITLGESSEPPDPSTSEGGAVGTGPVCDPTAPCGGVVYACGDGRDNDEDRRVDGADPDCLGPCDDGESTFLPAMLPDALDCARDCYFDANTGSGDDGCHWNPACDPLSPAAEIGCPYTGGGACPTSAFDLRQCVDFCTPLTPNGCDCYGCCTLEIQGELVDVFLGSYDCGSATPENCAPCTQRMEECGNPCDSDACEICFGETEPARGCGAPPCGDGVECSTNCDCPPEYFCLQGCCYPPPPGD